MDKRYQIFVSSTFLDLIDERNAVLNAILLLDHIPAGMELFPATNAEPSKTIKRVIELSDYYVLIIAGKYGSVTETGVSYTEAEYDYAKSLGKPVLAFLHANPGKLFAEDVEGDPAARERLQQFRSKVERAHMRDTWTSAEDLKSKVTVALISEIKNNPAIGWIRANSLDPELLQKYSAALEHNNELQQTIDSLRSAAAHLPSSLEEEATGIMHRISVPVANAFLSFVNGKVEVRSANEASERLPQIHSEFFFKLFKMQQGDIARCTPLGWALVDELNMRRVIRLLRGGSSKSQSVRLVRDMSSDLGLSIAEVQKLCKTLMSREIVNLKNGGTMLTANGVVVADRLPPDLPL